MLSHLFLLSRKTTILLVYSLFSAGDDELNLQNPMSDIINTNKTYYENIVKICLQNVTHNYT